MPNPEEMMIRSTRANVFFPAEMASAMINRGIIESVSVNYTQSRDGKSGEVWTVMYIGESGEVWMVM